MRSNDLAEKCSSSVYECLQGRRMPTRSYEHLVGAYGAAGFSGVKDARKSVFIADALSVGCLPTSGLQKVNKKETTGLQKVDSRETPELQHDYIPTTEMLQRSPNSGDVALWKQAEGAA